MRKILGSKGTIAAGLLTAFGCLISQSAFAEDASNVNNGFSLPGVSLSQGTDEVRAADGTSCRSAVGGAGAYFDMGMIGKPTADVANNNYYGRVVVPLGRGPKRLDCSKLYELEVERLKLELELAKAGLGRSVDPEIDSTQTTALPESGEPEKAEAEDKAPQVVNEDANEEANEEAALIEDSTASDEAQPVEAVEVDVEDDGTEVVVSSAAWGKASKVTQYVLADEKPVVTKAVAKKTVKPKVVKAVAKGIAAKPEPRLKTKKVGKAAWADEGWSDEGLRND